MCASAWPSPIAPMYWMTEPSSTAEQPPNSPVTRSASAQWPAPVKRNGASLRRRPDRLKTKPASVRWPAPAARNGCRHRWIEERRTNQSPSWPSLTGGMDSRPIRRLSRAAIEHLYLLLRDHVVEGQRLGLEIAFGHMRGLEIPIDILAAHQRRPIALAHGLPEAGRDIADSKPDAPVVGTVRLGAVEQQHVMQRRLAGLQLDMNRLDLVDLDSDLLPAGEQVVLVEGIGVLDLLAMGSGDELHAAGNPVRRRHRDPDG